MFWISVNRFLSFFWCLCALIIFFLSFFCLFVFVFVLLPTDKEEPIVSNCSMGVFVTTTQNTEAVTWVPPTFTDNVGVTSVSATNNPGDTFYQGTTNVKYTAKDAENNQAVCEFQVVVKSKCLFLFYSKVYSLNGVGLVKVQSSQSNFIAFLLNGCYLKLFDIDFHQL